MPNLFYAFVPVVAVLFGAALAVRWTPSARLRSSIQHLAAGVVFAAAAAEVLPQVKHDASLWTLLLGGALGVATMLAVKSLERKSRGSLGLLTGVSIDFFVDGLVLGLAFLAGQKAGVLVAVALTLEVLFLGLNLAVKLSEVMSGRLRTVCVTVGLALLLPLGALSAIPIAFFRASVIGGFLCFGLMALLYLVTEELLVEAHQEVETPLVTATFFVGFLGLLMIEKLVIQ